MKKNGNKGKRLLAGLLSFLMIASGTPLGELSVNASTLIPNTSLNDTDRYPYMSNSSSSTGVTYGSSESTGFPGTCNSVTPPLYVAGNNFTGNTLGSVDLYLPPPIGAK